MKAIALWMLLGWEFIPFDVPFDTVGPMQVVGLQFPQTVQLRGTQTEISGATLSSSSPAYVPSLGPIQTDSSGKYRELTVKYTGPCSGAPAVITVTVQGTPTTFGADIRCQ